MDAVLKKEFPIKSKEIQIDCYGMSFLVVCGTHINGAFAAIVNFGVSCELSGFSGSYNYNASKLSDAFCNFKSSWLPNSPKTRIEIATALSDVITNVIYGLIENDCKK